MKCMALYDGVNMESTWNEVTEKKNAFPTNTECSFCGLTKGPDLEKLKFGPELTVILPPYIQNMMCSQNLDPS